MKRHPPLIPLSRDHYDGLLQAVRLRRAAADGDAPSCWRVWHACTNESSPRHV